jgi:hypothetical protein
MESSTQGPRSALTEKLLRLLQAGTAGGLLASATVVTPPAQAAPSPRPESRLALEQRVDHLRKQLPAAPAADEATGRAEDLLAWWNWHNWRNGWPNGWHNWHNWGNWW